jgi:hypothetical protein
MLPGWIGSQRLRARWTVDWNGDFSKNRPSRKKPWGIWGVSIKIAPMMVEPHLGSAIVEPEQKPAGEWFFLREGVDGFRESALGNSGETRSFWPSKGPPNSRLIPSGQGGGRRREKGQVQGSSDGRRNRSDPRQNHPAAAQGDSDPRQNDSVAEQNDSATERNHSVPRRNEVAAAQDDSVPRQNDPAEVQDHSVPLQNHSVPEQNDSVPLQNLSAGPKTGENRSARRGIILRGAKSIVFWPKNGQTGSKGGKKGMRRIRDRPRLFQFRHPAGHRWRQRRTGRGDECSAGGRDCRSGGGE